MQRLDQLTLGEPDHHHHVQGIDVIGTGREYRSIERLGLREPPLLMQLQRLIENQRDLKRPGFWRQLRNDGSIPPDD